MWKKFLPATRHAFVLCALAMGAYACQHEPPVAPEDPLGGGGGNGGGGGSDNPCSPTTVYFQQQVLPILQSNCTNPGDGLNCHHTANDANDWIALTSYQSLMNSGIVGDGDLMEAITDTDPDDRMPRPPRTRLRPNRSSSSRPGSSRVPRTIAARRPVVIPPTSPTQVPSCHSCSSVAWGAIAAVVLRVT